MKIRTANMLSPRPSVKWWTYGAIAAWLAAVAVACCLIARYQFAALDSQSAKFVDHWPTGSQLPRQPSHSTLVLFLHPKCPCSRASVSELERLFASVEGRMNGKLDFMIDATVPPTAGDDWLQTDTMDRVKAMAGARVFIDRGGIEAASFGATTSGFVMLFDENGRRQYAGGVTESRGHEGDNAGCCNLRRVLCHETDSAEGIPAFGCQLCLPENQCRGTTVSETGAI